MGEAKRTNWSPRSSSREVEGKTKTTGGTARTRTFTKATEIKRAWSPPCRFCLWDCRGWNLKFFRGRASSRGGSRLAARQARNSWLLYTNSGFWSFMSIKDCPHTDCSTQTEVFDYLFTHLSTSKPFDQNYFRDDNMKMSFYTGLPT